MSLTLSIFPILPLLMQEYLKTKISDFDITLLVGLHKVNVDISMDEISLMKGFQCRTYFVENIAAEVF